MGWPKFNQLEMVTVFTEAVKSISLVTASQNKKFESAQFSF